MLWIRNDEVEFEKITYWREGRGREKASQLGLTVQKVFQFFSFAGQICFRSDVNTNNLYLLIFTTDGYSPTICHCRTWEQWRQSNDTIQATVQSMTFIAIFPRVLQRKQLNTNRMETVVDICFISDRWQSCSMVMNRGFFVRKSVIHFVWSEWTWGPSLVWWSQLTPSPPAYT